MSQLKMERPLEEYIEFYFLPLLDIPLEDSDKEEFLSAIKSRDKEKVKKCYENVLKCAKIGGDRKNCRLFFNRMRFYINQELHTTFHVVAEEEF